MRTGGFLIRFIDLGLIVLFAFVMISDIESTSRVDIAAEATAQDSVRSAVVFVTVRITADGAFVVSTPLRPEQRVVGRAGLETRLRLVKQEVAAGRDVIVLIQPDEASIVQAAVDVMDVCDRLMLKKSLQMQLAPDTGPGSR